MFRLLLFAGFLVACRGECRKEANLAGQMLEEDPCFKLPERAAMDHVLQKAGRLIKTYNIKAGVNTEWLVKILATSVDPVKYNVEIWKDMTGIWKAAHPNAVEERYITKMRENFEFQDEERSFVHGEKHVLQQMACGLEKYWQCRNLDSRRLTETVWSVILKKNFLEGDDQARIVLIARAFQKAKDQN